MSESNQRPLTTPLVPRCSRATQSHVAEVARAVTRPIVTIMFAGVIAGIVFEGITAPDWFVYGLAMPCILWWFGDRTIRHFKEKKGGTSA